MSSSNKQPASCPADLDPNVQVNITSTTEQELNARVEYAANATLDAFGKALQNSTSQILASCENGDFKSRYLRDVINFDGTRAGLIAKSLESKISKYNSNVQRLWLEIRRLTTLAVKEEVEKNLSMECRDELKRLIAEEQNATATLREAKKQLKRKQQAERDGLIQLENQSRRRRRLRLIDDPGSNSSRLSPLRIQNRIEEQIEEQIEERLDNLDVDMSNLNL